jgi:uncharacterized protein (DUF58 family)
VARARLAGALSFARRILPLTLRGLLLAVLAAGLLAAGLLRADLAALFWGSSFLLYTLYALAGGHLFRLVLVRRSRRIQDMVSVVLPPSGVFPGEELEGRFETRLPRASPPGFSVHVRLPLAWQDRKIDTLAARMSRGTSTRVVRFRAPWRGAFRSEAAVVECRDILGFSAGAFRIPLREAVTVYPALRDPGEAVQLMEQADESAVESRRRRRSDDLLEARKYYPGDDMRRLNWKVFAHLNELFLRVGEEVPPPEARLLFVLDTTTNPLVPRRSAAGYLDGLVSSCISVMDAMMGARMEVLLSHPGMRECRGFEARTALLAHAADAGWTDAPWAPDLPARPMHAAVFTSPGSPGLTRIMATIMGRGWSAILFVKGLDLAPVEPARTLADLFLVRGPRAAGAPEARPGERESSALSAAAARDLSFHRGGKVTHAVEV